ncbi:MAG: alpha/beta fold hydrolase [Holophagales bacterium]|nr:alpha/beta fold hydrolase [Holophagales bacterium]
MAQYGLEPVGGFCRALADETGLAVLSVEYRRVGEEGGGWPGTFLDAAAALDFVDELATRAPVSRQRVIVAGHSAGAHLALARAARPGLLSEDPLQTPVRIRPSRVVALGPLADLADVPGTPCGGALDGLLGPPSLRDLRLRSASPAARSSPGCRRSSSREPATGSPPSPWRRPTRRRPARPVTRPSSWRFPRPGTSSSSRRAPPPGRLCWRPSAGNADRRPAEGAVP